MHVVSPVRCADLMARPQSRWAVCVALLGGLFEP
jgi:hypothetical protein